MWKTHKPMFSFARGEERKEVEKTIERPVKFKEVFEDKKKSNIRSAKEIRSRTGGVKHKEADNAWMFEGRKAK